RGTANQGQIARIQDRAIRRGLFSPKSRHLHSGQSRRYLQNDSRTGQVPDEDATRNPGGTGLRALKQLIVNADDLGLTPGVNRGILRAFQDGIVTSASLLVTGSAFEDAVALAQQNPKLDVGLHLALVEERAALGHEVLPTLVDEMGRFPRTSGEFFRR